MTTDFEDIRMIEPVLKGLKPEEVVNLGGHLSEMMSGIGWNIYTQLVEERLTGLYHQFIYEESESVEGDRRREAMRHQAKGLVIAGKLPVMLVTEARRIKSELDAKEAANQQTTTGSGTAN